jgi:hypothetical protein
MSWHPFHLIGWICVNGDGGVSLLHLMNCLNYYLSLMSLKNSFLNGVSLFLMMMTSSFPSWIPYRSLVPQPIIIIIIIKQNRGVYYFTITFEHSFAQLLTPFFVLQTVLHAVLKQFFFFAAAEAAAAEAVDEEEELFLFINQHTSVRFF